MNQHAKLRGIWAVACGLTLTLAFLLYAQPNQAGAHGTNVTYAIQSTVLVNANFDTGEPMSEAQITVYSPEDPETVWLQGIADENGQFTFVPDPEISGDYDVSIRSAGHGEILSIPVAGGPAEGGGTSSAQQLIMAAAIIWGFIGTALYFSARNKTKKEEGNQEYAHT